MIGAEGLFGFICLMGPEQYFLKKINKPIFILFSFQI